MDHFCFLKNTEIITNKIVANMNMKRAFGEDSAANEERVIAYWLKRQPCYKVAETLSELQELVSGVQNKTCQRITWIFHQEGFQEKGGMQLGFSLLFIIKCEREEAN